MYTCFVINHDLLYVGFVKMISLAQNMNNSTSFIYQVLLMKSVFHLFCDHCFSDS